MSQSSIHQSPSGSSTQALGRQGPFSAQQVVSILRELIPQVGSLHAAGNIHGGIGLDAVLINRDGSLTLTSSAGVVDGGLSAFDNMPSDLEGIPVASLPNRIEEAVAVLRELGYDVDPRRVDVYQLGVLGCRLFTGRSLSAYLRSPKVKAQVPGPLQSLVDAALGFDPDRRISDCETLADALAQIDLTDDGTKTHSLADWPSVGPESAADSQAEQISDRSGDTPQPGALELAEPLTPASSIIVDRGLLTPPHVSGPSPTLSADLPFQMLGRYKILSRLGHGGMGEVYHGYDESLDRHVAIKVLPPELARHETFVRRFKFEAAAVAKLTHPNVVQVYFIGEDAGHQFFVMQLVVGESLAQLLARKGRLEVDEAIAIFSQCLQGLEAAHAEGLVHRDVKPGNVLLEGATGRVLLADFGLVKAQLPENAITATGLIMGTADYLSPEQARSKDVDGRADLYSLGVVLYQMLSGRLPFEAESSTGKLFQHAYESPEPLADIAPHVPAPLAWLVSRLMAKNRSERYQTAAEALADLESFLAGTFAVGHLPKTEDRGRGLLASKRNRIEPYFRSLPAAQFADWERWAPRSRWRRLRNRWADLFLNHAPEFVKKLQDTEQQVDGVIAAYQRRRDDLQELLQEAEEALIDLERMAEQHRAAGVLPVDANLEPSAREQARSQREGEAVLAQEFVARATEQREKMEQVRSRLGAVVATLQQLYTQRDLLLARLRSAHGGVQLETGRRPPRRWNMTAIAMACLLPIVGVVGFFMRLDGNRDIRPLPVQHDLPPLDPVVPGQRAPLEPKVTNTLGMQLTLIPPGEFMMGSFETESGAKYDEHPRHQVQLTKQFYMGVHEVTRAQFRKFYLATDDATRATINLKIGYGYDPAKRGLRDYGRQFNWEDLGWDQQENYPVTGISYYSAVAFCDWLSQQESKKYRLPTEAEWEYCCRAKTTSRFYGGDRDEDLVEYENTFDASLKDFVTATHFSPWNDGFPFTAPVGSFKPNPFGLHDMLGNVREFCLDNYLGNYGAPVLKTDPVGPAKSNVKVVRGGAWNQSANDCRSASRGSSLALTGRIHDVGFRVVLQIDQEMLAPAAPGPVEISRDPDRRAAEMVLNRRGFVHIQPIGADGKPNGNNVLFQDLVQLPPTPFQLRFADLGNQAQVTDRDLVALHGLKHLVRLNLHRTKVSDGGITCLEGLTSLEDLDVSDTLATDELVIQLQNLQSLKSLNLAGTFVTDEGMLKLFQLSGLEFLDLSKTPIRGICLQTFTKATKLKTLSLRGSKFASENAECLRTLSGLTHLTLSETQVSDNALDHLLELPNLQSLDLYNTQLTKAGALERLKEFKNLRILRLSLTTFGDDFVKSLQEALPDCKLEH
jgi:serine/threonine protein kinase/formylglycine-generating enzyme required for sulfatase activity